MGYTDTSRANFLCGSDNLTTYGEGYREEAVKIRKALVKHGFVNAGLTDAIGLWGVMSDERYAAGFIGVPDMRDGYESEDEMLDDIYEMVEAFICKTIYPDPE